MNEKFTPKYVSKYNSISSHPVHSKIEKVMASGREIFFSPKDVRVSTRTSIQNSYTKRIEKENMRKYD